MANYLQLFVMNMTYWAVHEVRHTIFD